MVHPLTLKKGIWSEYYGVSTQERVEYFLEAWYIIGSFLFVLGSYYFIRDTEQAVRPGCRLYDVGSIMFAAGAFLYLLEACVFGEHGEKSQAQRGCCHWLTKEVGDQIFYCAGSLVFLLGTLIWDPDLFPYFQELGGSELEWLQLADGLFMIGSFGFSFASFLTAVGVHRVHDLFQTSAIIITSCYEFGGFFFIAGTMAYMPGYHCASSLERLGGVMYLVGSVLYLVGCVISLCKTIGTYQVAREHWQAAETLQNMWRMHRQNKRFAGMLRRYTSMDLNDPESPINHSGMRELSPQQGSPPTESTIIRAHNVTCRLQRLVRNRKANQRFVENFGSPSPRSSLEESPKAAMTSTSPSGFSFACCLAADEHPGAVRSQSLRAVVTRALWPSAWGKKRRRQMVATTSPGHSSGTDADATGRGGRGGCYISSDEAFSGSSTESEGSSESTQGGAERSQE